MDANKDGFITKEEFRPHARGLAYLYDSKIRRPRQQKDEL
jgi:hypothetical protein